MESVEINSRWRNAQQKTHYIMLHKDIVVLNLLKKHSDWSKSFPLCIWGAQHSRGIGFHLEKEP